MLSFLIDNSTLIYILLAIASLALVLLWYRTKHARYLIGAAPILCLIAAMWAVDHFVDTDTKQIIRAVEAMRAGVQNRNIDQIFEHLSPDFHYGSHNFSKFRSWAEGVMRDGHVEDVIVWDFEPGPISREKRTAQIAFKVKARGDWPGSEAPYICRAEFVLDRDGQWRLRGFQVFNSYVNTTQPIDIPGL
jgi:hypothetical protein